jgi:tRNA-intron endonuclease
MSEAIPKALLSGSSATMKGPEADRTHQQGTFGEMEKGVLTLSDVEIMYLLEKDKISLVDCNGRALSMEDFLRMATGEDPDLWMRYLLYSDLRKRGYIVKPGFGPKLEYRVYRRGAEIGKEPAKYLVYGLVEGKPVSLHEIAAVSSSAKLSKKELIFAVTDRQGEITYYDASEIDF